jgi:hypothetical protein
LDLLKTYKWLLLSSAALVILACILKFVPLSKPLTQVCGLIELLLAIVTGVAFGTKATKKQLD